MKQLSYRMKLPIISFVHHQDAKCLPLVVCPFLWIHLIISFFSKFSQFTICILGWIHWFLPLGEFTTFHNQCIHLFRLSSELSWFTIYILRWIHFLLIYSEYTACFCSVNSLLPLISCECSPIMYCVYSHRLSLHHTRVLILASTVLKFCLVSTKINIGFQHS